MRLLIGTDDGVHLPGGPKAVTLPGRAVDALAADGQKLWAILDGRVLAEVHPDRPEPQLLRPPQGLRPRCVAARDGEVLVGASDARLLRREGGELVPVAGFDDAPGRAGWYTPWGGPPDVRSIAIAEDGSVYVNVHVGGILRSEDSGATWSPTIDVDADVHEVATVPGEPDRVFAATARGLATSDDAGESWRFLTDGLHAPYCRAVATDGRFVLVSASTGPSSTHGAVYRAAADGVAVLERCASGLPERFEGNVDTGCLAVGAAAVVATAEGDAYTSNDGGATWQQAASGLPPARCVLVLG